MKVDLYKFTDLLIFAESIGYYWKQAHDILLWDEILPINEIKKLYIHRNDFHTQSNYSDDTIKIVNGFLDKENIEGFTLVR